MALVKTGWVELKKQDSTSSFRVKIVESLKEAIEKSRQLSVVNSVDKIYVSMKAKDVITETVFVKSPLYGFALANTIDSNTGWKLLEMYKPNENAKIDDLISNQLTCRCMYPLSGFIESSLSDCLELNKLRIISIVKRSDSNWALGFQYKLMIAERNLTIDLSGTMDVNPKMRFVPIHISYFATPNLSKPVTITREVIQLNTDQLQCSRIVLRDSFRDAKIAYDYSDYATSIPDLAKFTLSHYGIPEPLGITLPSRTGYMLYLYIAIPVFAALGLFFAYLRRRSSRADALPPAGTAGS